MSKKRISIIGSTGSIGTQALEVLEKLQESPSFKPKNKSGFFDRMKDFF